VQPEHDHHPDRIAARLAGGPRINYLRDWVYGGIDGAVTTFAIAAGAVGADLSTRVVLILGIANVLADGFSMAAANFSGTRTEIDDYNRIRAQEERHVDLYPEGEREEVRQIFAAKGLEGEELERLVAIVTSSRRAWVDTMVTEEYGLSLVQRSPYLAALSTFVAFLMCGLVPLMPFALDVANPPLVATVATGAVFFAIGSIKSYWSTASWYRSGGETLAIGLAAAGIAYVVGALLGALV
jgi:vacuolar iron transporter family protein